MEDSTEILVVILSVTLAFFLLLSIVVVIKCIQILNRIKTILDKAEEVADKVEAVGEFFQQTATPVAIARLIGNISESLFKGKVKKKG